MASLLADLCGRRANRRDGDAAEYVHGHADISVLLGRVHRTFGSGRCGHDLFDFCLRRKDTP